MQGGEAFGLIDLVLVLREDGRLVDRVGQELQSDGVDAFRQASADDEIAQTRVSAVSVDALDDERLPAVERDGDLPAGRADDVPVQLASDGADLRLGASAFRQNSSALLLVRPPRWNS